MLTKQEIRQLGNKEMIEELQKSRRELLKAQFDIRSGSSKEVHMVKNLKRYIAVLQTIAKELKLETSSKMGKAEANVVAAEEKKTPAKATKKTTAKKATSEKSETASTEEKKAPAKAKKTKAAAKK